MDTDRLTLYVKTDDTSKDIIKHDEITLMLQIMSQRDYCLKKKIKK